MDPREMPVGQDGESPPCCEWHRCTPLTKSPEWPRGSCWPGSPQNACSDHPPRHQTLTVRGGVGRAGPGCGGPIGCDPKSLGFGGTQGSVALLSRHSELGDAQLEVERLVQGMHGERRRRGRGRSCQWGAGRSVRDFNLEGEAETLSWLQLSPQIVLYPKRCFRVQREPSSAIFIPPLDQRETVVSWCPHCSGHHPSYHLALHG